MLKDYRVGFSFWGLVLYVLQLLPNLVWAIFPPANDPLTRNSSPYPVLNVVESLFGIISKEKGKADRLPCLL